MNVSYKAQGGGGYTSTAARQSLSGFKVTSHVFARLQYDDANC